MAQSIRCPHCGKTYVLKPELAGKQVRCRQCQKAFTVPVAKPPDGLEEPIVLSLAARRASRCDEHATRIQSTPGQRTDHRTAGPGRSVGGWLVLADGGGAS